ncbi:MAG: dephospho-CoA kinase, partial [Desulfobacterales bacterium]|nr:dephospho-CoA kinase [Desulfobacterales bacterium]
EVPLLFETGMQEFFDYVIMVAGEPENRIRRIMERDNVSRREAEALMKTQMPESEKRRLSDFVIDNNAGFSEVYDEVDRIYAKLKAACKKTD